MHLHIYSIFKIPGHRNGFSMADPNIRKNRVVIIYYSVFNTDVLLYCFGNHVNIICDYIKMQYYRLQKHKNVVSKIK